MAFRGAALIVCALAIWHAASSEDCRVGRNIPAEQDEPLSVTCTVHGAHRLSWRLGPLRGETKNVGSCQLSGESACQVTGGDRYALTRQEPYTSTLTIAPSTQPIRMTLVHCTGRKLENGTKTELGWQYCWLLPMYPADKFKNCSLQWNSTDWTVSGFCEVDILSTSDLTGMLWEHYTSAGRVDYRHSRTKALGNHKVRSELSGLPMDTAHRSGYIDVIMWDLYSDGVFVARFPVEKPGDPELDNCPSYVTEGSNLTCRCRPSSSKPGTPRPVVTWTPKQAGDNQLHISNIQQESDKQTFTCYQYWGGWNDSDVRTVSYTVHVYYSEGNPDTSSAEPATTDDEYLDRHPRPTTQSAGEDCRDARYIPAEQDEPLSVTCTVRGAHRLSWRLGPRWRDMKNVGSCQLSGESACQVTGGDRYALSRQEPYTSTLTIAPSTQPIRRIYADCTDPADKFKNCSLQWNSTNWTVSGFCEVDKLNKSDWIGMLWEHYTSAGQVNYRISRTKPLGKHKIRGELRGLPMDTARRSGYIDVVIWDQGSDDVFVARFPVEKPEDPELDNCPSYVTAGSNLTCRCRPSSSKPGTPRPVVTWTPKQAGDNQLHISNIQRESDNQTFTCYQYWGGWNDSDVRTVSYTVYVYSDEKDDSPTVVLIACGLTGGLAFIQIIVFVIIIMERRRGSEGNRARRAVGNE